MLGRRYGASNAALVMRLEFDRSQGVQRRIVIMASARRNVHQTLLSLQAGPTRPNKPYLIGVLVGAALLHTHGDHYSIVISRRVSKLLEGKGNGIDLDRREVKLQRDGGSTLHIRRTARRAGSAITFMAMRVQFEPVRCSDIDTTLAAKAALLPDPVLCRSCAL